jgi:Predicted metal-sulfur cluster biosynthetic enzyme
MTLLSGKDPEVRDADTHLLREGLLRDPVVPSGQTREARMTDSTIDTPAHTEAASDPAAGGPPTTGDAPVFDAERRATELAILDALRTVVDPEIGMNVVELALIKQIILGPDSTEVKMILTTPFCPYAGSMIAQVKEQAESVVEHDVKVTLLAERWDPREAGLMW